jgi:phage gp29-like protein
MTECKHNWEFTDGGTGALKCKRCGAVTGPRTPEQRVQDILTVPTAQLQQYKLHDSRPANTVQFYGGPEPRTEVLRLSQDGIWANPDIPCDEAAKKVLEAIDGYVKGMVERVREEARQEMQARIDTLHAMYEQACRQRDELMDQQRAQIAAMRGRLQ